MDKTRSDSLRSTLLTDSATTGLFGLLVWLGAAPLARDLALPEPLLLWAGLALLPISAFMALTATRWRQPATVWTVIAGNFAYGVACLWLLVDAVVAPNLAGEVFLLANAVLAPVAGVLELRGLLRMRGPVPA